MTAGKAKIRIDDAEGSCPFLLHDGVICARNVPIFERTGFGFTHVCTCPAMLVVAHEK